MFCRKCGNQITEDAKFCTKCGTAIDTYRKKESPSQNSNKDGVYKAEKVYNANSVIRKFENRQYDTGKKYSTFKKMIIDIIGYKTDRDYLYYPNINNREAVYCVSFILEKIFLAIGVIIGIAYIIEQIQLDEGYKIIIYVIGFLVAVVPYQIVSAIFDLIVKVLKYEKKDIKDLNKSNLFLVLEVAAYVMSIFAMLPFINPSDARQAEWLVTVGMGNFFDIIECFAFTIICLIGSGIVTYFSEQLFINKIKEVE